MDFATNSSYRDDMRLVNRTAINHSFLWQCALCSLPSLSVLVTIPIAGTFETWQIVTRSFWLVAQVFEIATILFALSQGFSPIAQMKLLTKPVRLLAFLWIANVALATMLANDPAAAIVSGAKWLLHGLFAISLWHISKRWPANWATTFANALPVGTAVFAVMIISFVLINGVDADYDWVSSLPGFPHIRHPGYFLMPAMAVSTWMIFKSTGRSRYLQAGLLALNFGFTVWIGSRGPSIVYALLLVPALLIFAKIFAGNKIASLALATLAFFAGVLLSQSIPAPNNGMFNALSRFEGKQNTSVESFSSGRTNIWQQTITAVRYQPWIGHGGDQFRKQMPIAQNTYNHPHNSVLQFAYEWGIIGAFSLIALLAILAVRSLKATVKDPEAKLGMFFAASSMAFFSLIDGVFYYNLPIMLFLVFAFGTLDREKLSSQI